MARLLVHVEGRTEEEFVREVLAPHLARFGHAVSGRLIGHARRRAHRGGVRGWDSASKDIVDHLRGDPSCYATMMVDFYAMPQTEPRAWPGRAEAGRLPFPLRFEHLTGAVLASVGAEAGPGFNPSRFIPFVTMHEFEALLFSDGAAFASSIYRPDLAQRFTAIREAFQTPEHIDDSPVTAPSKRVLQVYKEYDKVLMGNLAAAAIGLERIRAECPLFDAWIASLETLP